MKKYTIISFIVIALFALPAQAVIIAPPCDVIDTSEWRTEHCSLTDTDAGEVWHTIYEYDSDRNLADVTDYHYNYNELTNFFVTEILIENNTSGSFISVGSSAGSTSVNAGEASLYSEGMLGLSIDFGTSLPANTGQIAVTTFGTGNLTGQAVPLTQYIFDVQTELFGMFVLNTLDGEPLDVLNGSGLGNISFGGTQTLSLEIGSLSAVPVPTAFWLFCSGLFSLVVLARKAHTN
jgi:hypothetical protein